MDAPLVPNKVLVFFELSTRKAILTICQMTQMSMLVQRAVVREDDVDEFRRQHSHVVTEQPNYELWQWLAEAEVGIARALCRSAGVHAERKVSRNVSCFTRKGAPRRGLFCAAARNLGL